MDNRQQIKTTLENAKRIAMFGHRNPDGDCVGSLLWMGNLLKKQGKSVSYFTPTPVSKRFDFLPEISEIKTEFDYWDYDVLLFVDFSECGRIQEFWEHNEQYFADHPIVVIDHHITKVCNPEWMRHSDADAMSACEVILELTHPWWSELYDEHIATCLYLGLTTDSGNFKYDDNHERILANAMKLIQLGAKKKLIIDKAIRRRSFRSVKMMERLFQRLQQKWGLVYSRYNNKDIEELQLEDDEADDGQIVIQDIEEAVVTSIFREQNGYFHGSMRSKDYNVEQIASSFGGGGHLHAAGFRVPLHGTFEETLEEISTKIAQMIN